MLYSFQTSLPKLPVPRVKDTIQRVRGLPFSPGVAHPCPAATQHGGGVPGCPDLGGPLHASDLGRGEKGLLLLGHWPE